MRGIRFYYLNKGYQLAFIAFLFLLVVSIFSNNDIRGVESNVIYTLQQILVDNSLLYQDPNGLPYTITQYTPLYYIICDFVISALSIESSEFYMIRIISRGVSMIFLIGSMFLFFKIMICQFNLSKKIAFLFSSLLVVFTFPWSSLSRPDGLILFFVLSAFYFLIRYINSNHSQSILFVGLCSFFAIASKQNGLILPLIVGVFFLLTKNWKAILLLIIGFVSTLFLMYLILIIGKYDLTYLRANIIDGINNKIDVSYALKGAYKDFLIYFGLFSITVIIIIKNKIKDWLIPSNSINFLFMVSLVSWFIISVIFALKTGSGVNYFNELITIMLLILAYELRNNNSSEIELKKMSSFLLAIGLQVCIIHFFYYTIKISKGIFEEYVSKDTSRKEIVSYLNENLNNAYFISSDRKINLAIHQKCVLPQFEIHFSSLSKKLFDYSNLNNSFNSGQIKYLILHSELSPILNIDITSLYEFNKKIGNLNIYKLKEN